MVLAVAILCGSAVIFLVVAASTTTTHHSAITLRLVLPERTVPDGSSMRAHIVVTNTYTRPVSLGFTCPGQEFEVGLTNAHVPFTYISDLVACFGLHFNPGRTTVPVTISTSYHVCGAKGTVRCTKKGMPLLPPGTYKTKVLTQGFPAGTKSPAPVSVFVHLDL